MIHFVFDVESVGLYGDPFAVGYVVVDDLDGRELDARSAWVRPGDVNGTHDDHAWVQKNIPFASFSEAHRLPRGEDLSNWFWRELHAWQEKGDIEVWADCAYPVETNFLALCVRQDPAWRQHQAPYPLHDIATLALACGYDPTSTWPRNDDELPVHNPLADARQSARLLVKYIKKMKDMGGMYEV